MQSDSDLSVAAKIEAVLFYKGESVSVHDLARLVGHSDEEVRGALDELDAGIAGRGIKLVRNDDSAMLGTSPAASQLIEAIQKDEVTRDLGKAGLETLAIVLYKGPVSRREIDYIRGVNSQFILRNLLVRGLIERTEAEPRQDDGSVRNDGVRGRGYYYRPTTELISFMGLGKVEDLPEFEAARQRMDEFSASEGSDANSSEA